MNLLIVAIVLALVHISRPTWPRLRYELFEGGFRIAFGLSRRLRLDDRVAGVLLIICLAGAVFAGQQWLASLTSTWPWFLFSLVVLLIAWGARDLDEDVEAFLAAGSDAEAQRAAAVLVHCYQSADDSPETVIKGVFYQALVRWFGVLFWFLVLGAAGAILFRLPHAMLSSAWIRERAGTSQTRFLRRITALLDLPPALLTTLALAVVGNFDAVTAAWRREFEERQRGFIDLDRGFLPEVGFQTVCAGDLAADGFTHSYSGSRARVQAAMNLVWRALMAWLTVLAVLIVAGLVS